MYQEERMLGILQYLREHGRIRVQDICEQFNVSRDTARRDLVKLSEQKLIIRTRGGAVLPTLNQEIESYKERLDLKGESKERIGREAAKWIQDYDTILLDTSTTVQYAAQAITAQNIVAVTNSIDIADILSAKPGVKIHVLGGILHARDRYLYGSETTRKLQEYKVNKFLMGAGGITDEGIFFKSEEDGQVVREMIHRAEQVIVLADHTKFGKPLFYKVCSLDQVDFLIADRIPERWKPVLDRLEIEALETGEGRD
ncbi:DeoR/GlpR transcriptional regulator [Thermoactinomyces sp. CICC 10521]|jgi:DeoR/GlpR family transcriptional regulator of sugar metabolism|uniref:DeoR/GlpR transcriptional regulator n=2 Tax=Thermoactinomycetaceae TaxID=186824 RepID=A0A7W1X9Z8_9BACL|nr:DeoR/GlpR transcriptional regulator [Thermoactinomyces daqus]MBH8598577.1 DeoR/GlpR transcriptional regulator [Thermoactinomyces sp. CICC 10523]MBH8604579.1 DeoR/GlpR transcriptional regulator [Thermoactinomyces sp. CICC 10522]MBH8606961.1 DeoR/GlpR transcriptional regulator [Thermoactinomyces sp. CICC 10521]